MYNNSEIHLSISILNFKFVNIDMDGHQILEANNLRFFAVLKHWKQNIPEEFWRPLGESTEVVASLLINIFGCRVIFIVSS